MFATRRQIAILAVCSVFSPFAAAVEVSGGTAADRSRMLEIAREWVAAYRDGDLDAMMALMHEDAMIMAHNQPTVRGHDAVREYFAARIGRPGVTFIDHLQEIRIEGAWAYVLGEFRVEITTSEPSARPFVHNGRYFVLYAKTGRGEWKMLRDMDNAMPTVPPGD